MARKQTPRQQLHQMQLQKFLALTNDDAIEICTMFLRGWSDKRISQLYSIRVKDVRHIVQGRSHPDALMKAARRMVT